MAKSQRKEYEQKQPSLSDTDGRIPPQAVEIEESVLGAMLIEPDAAVVALDRLSEDDFYKPSHRIIYSAISTLFEGDNPLDILTVENELRNNNKLETIGGPAYLSYLTRSVSSAASIEYHAQIIKEKSLKRRLIASCTEIVSNAYDPVFDPYDLLDKAENRLFELSTESTSTSAKPVSSVVKKTLLHMEELAQRNSAVTGVTTGLDVDKMTAGWQRGDLIIIAARPSMGKTAFVLTTARNAALHPNEDVRTAVAIFSLEMSITSLVTRLLTMEARVDAQSARTGQLSQEDFKMLAHAAGRLYDCEMFIDDTPSISIMEIRTKARRMKQENNIGLIIIDYLQLVTGGPGFEKNREQEIAHISRNLKALAKDLDVPVIALSQLNRSVEQRPGKRPQLSDLRESGSIEQDADVVCFLYRPEYYQITTDDEGRSTAGVAELIIGKQRNGPTGTQRLQFVNKYARFENLAHDYPMAAGQEGMSPPPKLPDFQPPQDDPYGKPNYLKGGNNNDDKAPF